MDPHIRQSWEEFLDPDVVRPRLIAASVYIAAFEVLKDAIVGNIRDFFMTGFDESGDKINPEYLAEVLARNRSPVHASLAWLKEHHAIDDHDVATFDRVKVCRNVLAHKLLSALVTDGLPPAFSQCFSDMVALVRKIEVWWITNVEIPTNPDFDGADVDSSEIVPGPVMTIELLMEIALGDDKRRRSYFDEFRKLTGRSG